MTVHVLCLLVVVVVVGSVQGQGLNVSILPIYDPPPDIILGENEYRAASLLTLSCQVTGATGALSYQWSSTCSGDCFFPGDNDNADTTAQIISTSFRGDVDNMYFFFLRSTDAGTYTCVATDSNGNTGSGYREVKIVGIGGYVLENSGGPRVLVNNDLVTPDTATMSHRLRVQCVSNSTTRDGRSTDPDPIGNVIGIDGNAIEIATHNGQVQVGRENSAQLGYLRVFNPEELSPINSTRQGVYTCQVFDANDVIQLFNIGIYPNGFSTPPTISGPLVPDLQQTVLEVTCTSTGSVATTVTWTKDDSPVVVDGSMFVLTQTVADRAASTYDNVLTVNAGPDVSTGVYCCTVTNDIGSAQSCVEVKIARVDPDPDPLVLGRDGALTCSSQLDVSSIQWVDTNGTVLENSMGEKSLQLLLGTITESLYGVTYTCIVAVNGTDPFLYKENFNINAAIPSDAIVVDIMTSGSSVAGDSYTLTCTITKNNAGLFESPTAQWLGPGGEQVDSGPYVTVGTPTGNSQTSIATLTFTHLHTSFGDEYICRGVVPSPAVEGDITANASHALTVTIPAPTVVVTVPEGTHYIGTPLNLTCELTIESAVDTTVTVEVTWAGPGVMPGHTIVDFVNGTYQNILEFNPLSASDRGQYSCEATVGPVSGMDDFVSMSVPGMGSGLLTVHDLPVDITPTGDSVAGNTYILTCTVIVVEDLVTQPTVEWLDTDSTQVTNGSDITVSNVIVSGSNTITLTLKFNPLHTSHGGQYTCRASHNIDTVADISTTTSMNITVQIPPPEVAIMASRNGSLIEGIPLVLTCTTTLDDSVDDGEVVSTEWTGPEGTVLSNGGRLIITDAMDSMAPYDSMIVYSLLDDVTDTGMHTCRVTVSPSAGRGSLVTASTAVSRQLSITVQPLPAPTVVINTTDGNSTAGNTYALTCTVTVVENLVFRPTIEWLDSDKIQVMSGSGITVGSTMPSDSHIFTLTLEFNPLRTSHGGQYTCRAAYNISSITIINLNNNVDINVIVQIPPPEVISMASRSDPLYAGTSLALTCTTTLRDGVDNDEVVSTEWSGPGLPSDRTTVTDDKLDFSVLDGGDSGTYTCVVTVTPRSGRESYVTASTAVDRKRVVTVLDLPAPVVDITTNGDSVAGNTNILTCTVIVVEDLVTQPTVEWLDTDNVQVVNGSDITVADVMPLGNSMFTLTLEFNPLHTSHGGQYTCRASHGSLGITITNPTGSVAEDVSVQLSEPSVVLTHEGIDSLHHGDPVVLNCTVSLLRSVDTTVMLDISFTGTDVSESATSTSMVPSGPQSFQFTITPSTAGDFTYACTAITRDSTSSTFITDSSEGSDTETISVDLNVSILPVYDPPPDIILGENEYRAASLLTLSCQVTGATGVLSYQWSSTCTGDCFFPGDNDNADTTAQNVSTSFRGDVDNMYFFFLRSTDAGTYTCVATDSNGNTGSGYREVKIVGIGGYVLENSGGPRVLVNNDLVTPNTATSRYNQRLRVQCVSNSTTRDGRSTDPDPIGNVIGIDGNAIEIATHNDQVQVGRQNSAQLGYLRVFNPEELSPIDPTRQGVYTCQIFDANDVIQLFNIGIYPNGFNTPPTISGPLAPDLQQTVLEVTCTSTGSVATTVTWTKDDSPVVIDGSMFVLTQTVADRAASTYDNVLTVNAEPDVTTGVYCCTVTNDIGSAQSCVEVKIARVDPDPDPLVLGRDGALTCSSQLDVSSIQWVDTNGTVLENSMGEKSLQLLLGTITESLYGVTYTCIVAVNGTDPFLYKENFNINAAIPSDAIVVDIMTSGSSVAGDSYTLTCTITKNNAGLFESPTAQWLGPGGEQVDSGPYVTVGTPTGNSQTSIATLTFTHLHTSFGDEYICWGVVPSPAVEGDITANASHALTVTIPAPTVVVTVPEGTHYIGTPLNLTCELTIESAVDTTVTVEVTWAGPGVMPGHTIVDFVNGTYQNILEFNPLSASDRGQYSCEATVGPVSGMDDFVSMSVPGMGSGVLTVHDLPVDITPTGDSAAGNTYVLTCTVIVVEDLVTQPTVEWLDTDSTQVTNGSDITVSNVIVSGSNTITLILKFNPLHTSHGGQYTCRASHNIDTVADISTTTSMNITVQIPPPEVAIMASRNDSLIEGTPLVLTCTTTLDDSVDDGEVVSTEWTGPEGTVLLNGGRLIITDAMDSMAPYGSMIVYSLLDDVTDTGMHTCRVTVSPSAGRGSLVTASTAVSRQLSITVQPLPAPTVVINTTDGNSTAGNTYALTCTVTVVENLVFQPTIEWLDSDKMQVMSGSGITVGSMMPSDSHIFTLTLEFNPLRTSHGGQYTCRAAYNISSTTIINLNNSLDINVIVQIPPPEVISMASHSDPLYAGTSLALTCTTTLREGVDNDEVVSTEWSGPGLSSDRTTVTDDKLDFSVLDVGDSGTYTCVVTVTPRSGRESYVTASTAVDRKRVVTVLDLPAPVVDITTNGDSVAGNAYILTCTVIVVEDLVTQPTVEWLDTDNVQVVNGSDITVADVMSLGNSMFTLTLEFNPLHTSHGGQYTCRASHGSLGITITNPTGSVAEDVSVQLSEPSVVLTHEGIDSLHHGDPVMLICTVSLLRSVDTTVMLNISFTGTDVSESATSTSMVPSGPQSFQFTITPSTAGDFTYACTATTRDLTSSTFITDSSEGSDTETISVDLNVSILPVYDPPPDIILGENEYRAASLLTLSCQVTGATGALSYQWSSTCSGDCFFPGDNDNADTTAQNVSTSFRGDVDNMYFFFLRSTDAGTYTCVATDSNGNTGSGYREVKIVGIGGYVLENSGGPRVLVNNDLVTPNTATSRYNQRLRVQCVSNSTTRDGRSTDPDPIGNVIGIDGNAIEIATHNDQVQVGRQNSAQLGYLRVFNPEELSPIDPTRQGVYTCQVFDANDVIQLFNIGIYPNGFSTPPTISGPLVPDLQQTVLEVTCTSTGSVATTVTWTKDDSPVVVDGSMFVLTQTVADRAASTYDNVLTVNAGPDVTTGVYCCTVTNDIGSAQSCMRALYIPDPGVLTVGETGTLTCFSDLPLSMIEWVGPDGITVTMTTTEQFLDLTFDPVVDNLNSTIYTCRVTTANSILHMNITLSVEVPTDPISVSISSSGSGVAGSTYTLTCTVTEEIAGLTGRPTILWMLPSALTGIVGNLSIGDQISTHTLTFSPLRTSHGGSGYTCQGMVPLPAADDDITYSKSSSVTVIIPQPTVDIAMDTQLPHIGTVYSLTCSIGLDSSVDTSVTVSGVWSKGGIELVEDSNGCLDISDATSTGSSTYVTSLIFIPLLNSSAGQYSCGGTVVPNDTVHIMGISNSGDYQLTVQDLPPPAMSYTTPGTPIIPGQPYTLTCTAVTAGKVFWENPTLFWLNGNGGVIPESSDVNVGSLIVTDTIATLELTFTSYESRHVGDYICRGCINVPKVSITDRCDSVTVKTAISGPCPTVVQDLAVHIQSDSRVTIIWREPAQPQGDIIGYAVDLKQYASGAQGVVTQSLDGFPLTTLQETSLDHDTLMAGVPYEVTARASNIVCYGEPARFETFFTREEIPAKVSDVSVDRTSDTSITVRWTRLTIVEARGVITGYIIEYQPMDNKKKQIQQVTAGPEASAVVISNLGPSVEYSVTVYTTSGGGQSASDPVTIPAATSGTSTVIIIGAVVAVVVVLAVLAIVTIVIVWLILSHKRAVLSLQKDGRSARDEARVVVSGDTNVRTVVDCPVYGAVSEDDHDYEAIPMQSLPPSLSSTTPKPQDPNYEFVSSTTFDELMIKTATIPQGKVASIPQQSEEENLYESPDTTSPLQLATVPSASAEPLAGSS